MEPNEQVLEKWKVLISACKSYYVDSVPTGLTDSEYDLMEHRALLEDKFYVRDYVFQTYMKGCRAENSYIEKIKKEKVEGKTMLQAIQDFRDKVGDDIYADLKYDGSSIAVYVNPQTGKPKRVVTCGNLNLNDFGIDQTWKLFGFLPSRFPKGIVAIQCEALIDTDRLSELNPDRARQRANGLINSIYCDTEVNNLLTLRAYRYYTDDSVDGVAIRESDYREILGSFETVRSRIDGHVLFAPADIWTLEDLYRNPGYCETDRTITSTGTFLNDGWVIYSKTGKCLGALKFAGAGSGTEGVIKSTVQSIKWNNQASKGKDSWSANVIIDPVTIKGCVIKKPSAGSVGKMVKNLVTPGAEVSIILANSTIPMVGETFKPGNGDFMWPTCSCGYHMSEKDIYGSLLKCGNPECSERRERMRAYLRSLSNIQDLDLNKYLVIDRFKWEETGVEIAKVLDFVKNLMLPEYCEYLKSFMRTDLQKKTFNLVGKLSFDVLRENYEDFIRN